MLQDKKNFFISGWLALVSILGQRRLLLPFFSLQTSRVCSSSSSVFSSFLNYFTHSTDHNSHIHLTCRSFLFLLFYPFHRMPPRVRSTTHLICRDSYFIYCLLVPSLSSFPLSTHKCFMNEIEIRSSLCWDLCCHSGPQLLCARCREKRFIACERSRQHSIRSIRCI